MKRAIIIGLNYTGQKYALPDCEQDADAMVEILKSRGVECSVVKGECSPEWLLSHLVYVEATRQGIADTLYIYFSGHGTQFPDPDEPNGTGEALCLYEKRRGILLLKDGDLKAAIDRIPGTKIVILDSCFSGGMDREAVAPVADMRRKSLQYVDVMTIHKAAETRDVLRFTPQYFLFACGENEVSYSTGNGGAFTLSLKYCTYMKHRRLFRVLRTTRSMCLKYGQTPTAHVVGGSYSKRVI